ncbi:MAG TPA: dihydrofolate reductase family protein [Opitutaceae bacterium]|nr:dihydrofolate reductase family protein [Opitutaceae bacterium]
MQITIISAQSVDGFITQPGVAGTAFTSEEDRAHFQSTLAGYDCSVMGAETYRVARDFIRPRLTSQRCRHVLSRNPMAFSDDQVPGQLEFSSHPVPELVATLRGRGFKNCAILGGAFIHSLFLAERLVDRLILTVEPRLFGGGVPFLRLPTDIHLALERHETLGTGSTLLLTYRVLPKQSA